ncbi:MAG: sulfotransferase family 2 domain-containing protein [Boseongicola sp.]|nr:sulfotransferase family 2 domain-containing protein [Boseongicola sp.]
MIGRRRKFIFVHVPKNGGQSITKALRPHSLKLHERLVQRAWRHLGSKNKDDLFDLFPGGGHATASQIKQHLGKNEFETFYSFGFVRNPWDWGASLRSFSRIRPKSPLFDVATNGTLGDFLEAFCAEEYLQQLDYLYDTDGRCLVSFVGRFERLREDFRSACDKIGISCELPHKNASKAAGYRELYDDAARQIVEEKFADDIREFGYTF